MNRIFNLTRVVFKAIKDFIMLLIKFAIDLKKGDLVKYNTTNDYYKQFEGKNENDELKVAKAYEIAWDARKFEIDKRCTRGLSTRWRQRWLTIYVYQFIRMKDVSMLSNHIKIGLVVELICGTYSKVADLTPGYAKMG